MGKQCACSATHGGRETRAPAATTYSFCLAMRVGLAPAALHTACGGLWVMGNNAPAALHGVGGETGSPAATTYSFCFAIRVALAPTQSSKMTPSSLTPPRRLVGACSRRRRPCLTPTACSAVGALAGDRLQPSPCIAREDGWLGMICCFYLISVRHWLRSRLRTVSEYFLSEIIAFRISRTASLSALVTSG